MSITELNAGLPVVLFPVRIETRFRAIQGVMNLLVRIYPDAVHVDGHEPELTELEQSWGQHFWVQLWLAAGDGALRGAAWAQLVGRFGGPRGAWVAEQTRPLNPEDMPATPPAGGVLAVPPAFPVLTLRADVWTRASRAALMPSAWQVCGWRDGVQVVDETSSPIRVPLAMGPHPQHLGASGGEIPVDAGIQWLVDFNEAVSAGMAVKFPFPAGPVRLDRLIVFGLRNENPGVQVIELASHLTALRHSVGLDFAPQGMATNSTDAVRSGWATGDDNESTEQALNRWLEPTSSADVEDNANVVARALYIDRDVLARCRHASDSEQRDARNMNQLLWPVTGGYFMDRMMGPTMGVTATIQDQARDHWVKYVRGRGPFPAIRVGRQPYGLLPVPVGEVVDPRQGFIEDRIAAMVQVARETWNASTTAVPRIRAGSPDADKDLVEALSTLPNPQRFSVRLVIERSVLKDFANTLGVNWAGDDFAFGEPKLWLDSVLSMNTLGAPIHNVAYSAGSREWVGPLVDRAPLSDFESLTDNYLAWISTASLTQLQSEVWTGQNDSLLYVLARRSRNIWETMPTVRGSGQLAAVKQAAAHLATVPTSALEVLLTETLASVGYRLDSWEMSLVARRLGLYRQAADADTSLARGIVFGAYGWVEDLVPRSAPPTASPPNLGFIHAPTVQHGATAALLRNAWASHGATADTPFAIDVSSARARDAQMLLDGVRDGFTIGELLGYRFERQLHEGHPGLALDQFIKDFRNLAPMVANKQPGTEGTGEAADRLAGANVVDGLRLVVLWRAQDPSLVGLLAVIEPQELGARDAVISELEGLVSTIDSMADVAMAEGVHQLAQGNTVRAAAIMDAVSTGANPPPELDLISPPRASMGVVHRLILPLSDANVNSSAWPGTQPRPREALESQLDRWLTSVLPDPSTVVFRVSWTAGNGAPATGVVQLSDLGLAAVEAVMTPPAATATDGEFGALLDWHIRRVLLGVNLVDAPYSVDQEFTGGPGTVSLADFALLARGMRDLVSAARPMVAPDLAPPIQGTDRGVDLVELKVRSDVWAGALRTAKTALDSSDANVDPEAVRTALRSLGRLGVQGALPRSVIGTGATHLEILAGQQQAVSARVDRILLEVGEDMDVAAALATADDVASEKLLITRLKAIFGRSMPVLPRFVVAQPSAVDAAFAASPALQTSDALASTKWLHQVGKVRPVAQQLLEVMQIGEALSERMLRRLTVAQYPYAPGDRWAGLPFNPANPPEGGRVSIVSVPGGEVEWSLPAHGLVFDEWTEAVPRARQTTSLVVHYDAPQAQAPQAVLVLSTLSNVLAWSLPMIRGALGRTLDAARRRLADVTVLEEGGHFIPAVFIPTSGPGAALAADVGRGIVTTADAVVTEPVIHPL